MKKTLLQTAAAAILALAAPVSCFAAPTELPKPTVCSGMEEAGEALRQGQVSDFYFVQALGHQFPVPTFLAVSNVGGNYDVKVEALYTGEEEKGVLDAADQVTRTRAANNACQWYMAMTFGKKANFEAYTGGEKKLNKTSTEQYQIGDMRVWLPGGVGGDLRMVIAANEEGFVAFHTSSVEGAYWLLHLFEDVNGL